MKKEIKIKAWAVINTLEDYFENCCTIELNKYTDGDVGGLVFGLFEKKKTAKAFRDWIGEKVVKVRPCEIRIKL